MSDSSSTAGWQGGRLAPNRFAIVPDELLADQRVSASAVRVYAVIVRYQGRHEVAWPGLRTIERDYGIPRSTALRALETLEEAGWVEVERRPGTSTLYRPVEVSHQRDTVSHQRDGVSHQRDVTIPMNESQEREPPLPPARKDTKDGQAVLASFDEVFSTGYVNRKDGAGYARRIERAWPEGWTLNDWRLAITAMSLDRWWERDGVSKPHPGMLLGKFNTRHIDLRERADERLAADRDTRDAWALIRRVKEDQ